MKRILSSIILGAFILTSGAAFASPAVSPDSYSELAETLDLTPAQKQKLESHVRDKLKQRLGLNDQQADAVQKIRQEARQNRKAILSKHDLTEKEWLEITRAMKELRQTTKQKIQDVLTDEQKEKLRFVHEH